MKNGILVLVMLFYSTIAWGDWAVKGEGNYSCPDYLSAKRNNNAKLFSSISWVQGFITGVNYQRASESDSPSVIGRDFPAASMARWLENYCNDNLSEDLADAAKAMVQMLENKDYPDGLTR